MVASSVCYGLRELQEMERQRQELEAAQTGQEAGDWLLGTRGGASGQALRRLPELRGFLEIGGWGGSVVLPRPRLRQRPDVPGSVDKRGAERLY
ncbi:hypothetical protein ACWDSL_33450 [Streptomyces sp. NPDC000941]